MVASAQKVVTDLDVCISPAASPATCDSGRHRWHRIEKDLFLNLNPLRTAWLFVATARKKELSDRDLVLVDIRVGKQPNSPSDRSWESRPCGIWVLRSYFAGTSDQVITEVDVLFGSDAVEPRESWCLMRSSLQLNLPPTAPIARLSLLHGEARQNRRPTLRVKADGTFKIVQISDTHMGTGVGVCKDAIDEQGNFLPECEADPRTTMLMETVLDDEKPDLVVFTGDQLHHDIPDSQSALFKVTAPIIERSIPFAAVFGNHDSEGSHALSRTSQMSIIQDLPFSLCESGPQQVEGVGNFFLRIMAPAPSQRSLSTLYFLDSHGQIPSETRNPDYEPIKQSQIDWFVETSRAQRSLREKDGDGCYDLALAFLHIPFPEFGASHLNIRSGRRREPTEGPSFNSHLYDAMANEGISAVSCGHDHVNDFCALLPRTVPHTGDYGPWLCYGGSCGFRGYGSYGDERYPRRVRVWELDTNIAQLRTWVRVEHVRNRIDELTLVDRGKITQT